MITLADAAPTGAGLAIVGVILLAFLAVVIGTVVLVIVLIVKARRRRNTPSDPGATPPGWPTSG